MHVWCALIRIVVLRNMCHMQLWTLELTLVQNLQQLQNPTDYEYEDSVILSSDHDDEQDSADAIQADHSGFTSSSSSSSANRGKQASGFKKAWLKGGNIGWCLIDCKLCIKRP